MATAATAEDRDSANYLLPACKAFLVRDNKDPGLTAAWMQGVCVGIVETIAFMAANSDVAVTALSGAGRRQMIQANWRCANIPDEVTKGQLIRVVISYIDARPSRMHEPFKSLALEAILNAWPCRN
jgi:hypothetical protein